MFQKPFEATEQRQPQLEANSHLSLNLNDYKDYFSNNKTTDHSLVTAHDGSLSFDTASLYSSTGPKSSFNSQAIFDAVNTNRSDARNASVLDRREVTNAAFKMLIESNTNGNDKVDRNEWLGISDNFGLSKEQANKLYDQGLALGRQGASLYQTTEQLLTPIIMGAADTNRSNGIDRQEFSAWADQVEQKKLAGNDNSPDAPHGINSPEQLQALHNLVELNGSASIYDLNLINKELDKLPDAQKQFLLDHKTPIQLYGKATEDPNQQQGAAAYTDGQQIVVYMDKGLSGEALRHEVFHVVDLNAPNGGLVTQNSDYLTALQKDINGLTTDQFSQLVPVLADGPYLPTKFGNVPIGDIAAEQYAGLTGPSSSFGNDSVSYLPNSTSILQNLTQIA